jgi:hypothetical protein
VGHDAAHEQAAVTGEQDAVIGGGDPGQFRVVGVRPVPRVEPEQSQAAGERAEVDIAHEPRGDRAGRAQGP